MEPRFPAIAYDAASASLYRTVSLGLGVVTIPANLLLLFLLFRVRLFTAAVSYQLIGLLAVSDLLHGSVILAARLTEWWVGPLVIVETDWYCQTIGTVSHGLICTSAYLLGLLAFERYWLICRDRLVSPLCLWTVFGVTEVALIIPLTMSSLAKNLGADPIYGYCLPYGSAWATITSTILVGSFIVPLAALVTCYVAISRTICRHVPDRRLRRVVVLKSSAFIAIYSLCYLPKFLTSLWWRFRPVESIPRLLHVVGPLGVILPHLLNPLLVFAIHAHFKREAKRVLFPSRHDSLKSIIPLAH